MHLWEIFVCHLVTSDSEQKLEPSVGLNVLEALRWEKATDTALLTVGHNPMNATEQIPSAQSDSSLDDEKLAWFVRNPTVHHHAHKIPLLFHVQSHIKPVCTPLSCVFNLQATCVLYIGQVFRYSPENAFYIFNQQIYFIIWYLLYSVSLI